MGHCPIVVRVKDTQRENGSWICSSDETDNGTCLIAHHYLEFIITSLLYRKEGSPRKIRKRT